MDFKRFKSRSYWKWNDKLNPNSLIHGWNSSYGTFYTPRQPLPNGHATYISHRKFRFRDKLIPSLLNPLSMEDHVERGSDLMFKTQT